MNNELSLLATTLGGALVGVILAWYVLRQKASVAFEQGAASINPELAATKARLEGAIEERKIADAEKSRFEVQAAELRTMLDAARDECARLNERASRVQELENDLTKANADLAKLQSTYSDLREQAGRVEAELNAETGKLKQATDELSAEKAALAVLREESQRQAFLLAETRTLLESERAQAEEKLALLSEAQEKMSNQFKVLAGDILTEKAKVFGEQSQSSLNTLLDPLKEKIKDFQAKVEEVYVNEAKERHSLQEEVKRLAELNVQISDDAVKLTKALKGDSKTQGIWGERVLESVLESSGLRKGEEYEVQASYSNEEGGRSQPDVVVHLPEGKQLVVDSKVSLTAYERFVNADNDDQRDKELKAHVNSIYAHIEGLSEKKYQTLYGLKSVDFVLMFIPVEPAFMLGVTADHEIFNKAFKKNVLLVSPSTLLATLRTIANVWRQEHQSRNAQAIAGHCASLYDKFAGFVADMEDIGKKLDATKKSYDDAKSKLSTGKGNLLNQVERVRKLGVKPTKTLPSHLLDLAEEELQHDGISTDGAV